MQTVRLGTSGLVVTKVGFGGIPLQRCAKEEAVALVRHALARGINWIDTGHSYGHSEEVMGEALKGADRSAVRLFTKANARTREAMEEQVALSFKRLALDYIDLYQYHCVPDRATWERMKGDGTVDVLMRYKEQGKIGHIGASAHNKNVALMLLDDPHIEVLQWPFNFIVESHSRAVLEKCIERDVGFIAMKPFGGGMIPDIRACMRFQFLYPQVAADPGFETVREIDEVVALAEEGRCPTPEDRANMERLGKELGTEFCRRCGYCSPCPNGVSIVSLMVMESFIKRFPLEKLVHGEAAKAAATANSCTLCGECEPKCPFELKIMERIKRGAEAYYAHVKAHGAVGKS